MPHSMRQQADEELVPVPVDAETLWRLVRFAAETGKHPLRLAADLLRDVLADDEAAHGPPGNLN